MRNPGARTVLIVTVVLLLVSAVSATSFGSMSSDTKKTITGNEASYRLSVFNLGSRTLEVRLSTELKSGDPGGIRIAHPATVELEPSQVTRNPADGPRWFLLDDGRYVELTDIPVRVFVEEERSSNNFRFQINLRASPKTGASGSGDILQSISQVRSYTYELDVESPRTGSSSTSGTVSGPSGTSSSSDFTSPSGGFSGTIQNGFNAVGSIWDSATSGFNLPGDDSTESAGPTGSSVDSGASQDDTDTSNRAESSQGLDKGSAETDTPNEDEGVQGSTISGSNRATGGFFQGAGVNTVTLVLLVGVLLSSLYLLKVIEVV